MPRLYGTYRSRASRNLWLAEEAGLEIEIVPVWQARRVDDPEAEGAPLNTRSAEFLALSPLGAIPVLVDGDLVLTESLAINLHLARTRGGDLGPQDEAEDARMTQWALLGATSLETPALAILQVHDAGREGTEAGAAELESQAGRLRRPLDVLERHLAGHAFLVGDRFTVADVNTAEILRYAQPLTTLFSARPAVDAWIRRCQARPAFQRMWAKRDAEPLRL